MFQHLNYIADIQLGHPFRTGIEHKKDGDIDIIQQKDVFSIDEQASLDKFVFLRGSKDDFHQLDKYLLQPGDLLFRSRGVTPTAVHYCEAANKLSLPRLLDDGTGGFRDQQNSTQKSQTNKRPKLFASPLIRLRVTHNSILPQYLKLWINSIPAQEYFSKNLRGQSMQYIDMQTLANLEVPFIPLEKQQQLVAMEILSRKESAITTQLIQKKQVYYRNIFTNFIHQTV